VILVRDALDVVARIDVLRPAMSTDTNETGANGAGTDVDAVVDGTTPRDGRRFTTTIVGCRKDLDDRSLQLPRLLWK